MSKIFRQRTSESPDIDMVWQVSCIDKSTFIAPALGNIELVITRHTDYTHLSIWGGSEFATSIICPAHAKILGIRLHMSINIQKIKPQNLVNRHILLPSVNANSFELDGTWKFPELDDAEDFIEELFKYGYLMRNSVVEAVLEGCTTDLSTRSIQRHFQKTVGIPQRTLYQIERAYRAVELLKNGYSILDTVHEIGYFDQPHLTRCLKLFIGQTPAKIVSQNTMT
ncbi:MAG: helix-turn-helix domain-containing protein [Chloroflexota bacterium]